jgi:hypothetical protein
MTFFEGITTAIAVVALIISAAALRRASRANRIAEEANDLAKAPADLAKMRLAQEEARRNKTSVSLALYRHQTLGANGRPFTDYRFRLTNNGDVPAVAAGFEITTADNPLVEQDYVAKLPASIAPRQFIDVLAAVHMGSPSRWDAIVFWTNPEGIQEALERVVTM